MTIDNIVAEEGFSVNEDAITALLKTVSYNNSDTISGDTKTVTSTITNNGSTLLTDEVINNLKGFNSNEILPTLNLVSSESDVATQFEEINVSVLTSKIEEVQQLLNNARVQAGSQYMALESALTSTTDLTTQYEMGYNMLHDLDLSNETAELTKKQILQQAAYCIVGSSQQWSARSFKDADTLRDTELILPSSKQRLILNWWVMRDSNSRHLRCKRSALPTELITRPALST